MRVFGPYGVITLVMEAPKFIKKVNFISHISYYIMFILILIVIIYLKNIIIGDMILKVNSNYATVLLINGITYILFYIINITIYNYLNRNNRQLKI